MATGNIEIKRENGRIVITIDESVTLGPSSTGKTLLVASTGGFVAVDGAEVRVNVTATRKTDTTHNDNI